MCSHYVIFKSCFPRENRHAMLPLRQRAWNNFPEKVKNTYVRAVPKDIDADKASAPRYCAHTRRPAGDPHRPGEYCGAREVRDDLFPTNATSPRHVVRASMSSMYFWIPGAEVPGGPALCRKPNSMRYAQRHQVPNWLMTSVRNIYRTDTLTTRNENFLCFNVGEEIIRRHCRKRITPRSSDLQSILCANSLAVSLSSFLQNRRLSIGSNNGLVFWLNRWLHLLLMLVLTTEAVRSLRKWTMEASRSTWGD